MPVLNYPPLKSCPCGSGRSYQACCQPYLEGARFAPTAEALMRSRYTAYTLRREAYLLGTWHASTRPESLDLEDAGTRWQGLTVKRTEAGGEADSTGTVEFVARYRAGGERHVLHEVSRFVREDRWYYVDGTIKR